IAEGFDQRLDDVAVILAIVPAGLCGPLVQAERTAQTIENGGAEAQALDALRRPIGGNLVATHAPDLFRIGLEEDREQPLAELVADPLVKRLGIFDRKSLRICKGCDAEKALQQAEIAQRLEGLERIGIEFPPVEDARESRP